MKNRLIITGAGGHGKVVADAALRAGFDIIGFTDRDEKLAGTDILGIRILGGDDRLAEFTVDGVLLANGVGSVVPSDARREVFEKLKENGCSFASIIHPGASASSFVVYGEGIQVMAGAVVQPGCVIGDNSLINTRASVDHDCRIGRHVHIAPGAIICGGVKIGNNSLIGAGATVIQGVTIGAGCFVGAGAVVVRDIPDNVKAMGVPARAVKQ